MEGSAAAPGPRIYPATVDACAGVLALWAASGAKPTTSDSVEALVRLLRADPDALLLAEVEGQLVGTVIAAWNGWRGSLYRLAVRPERRRHGVGSALVLTAEEYLRTLGAVRIDAIVDVDDVGVAVFWSAAEYRRQGRDARVARDLPRRRRRCD